MANHLFISRETVRWHLRSLYSKIGVADRAAAVDYARKGSRSTGSVPDLSRTGGTGGAKKPPSPMGNVSVNLDHRTNR
jgi:hypothetical protein